MADETPAASPDPNEDPEKKETIRITLPSTTETPVAKRELSRPYFTAPVREHLVRRVAIQGDQAIIQGFGLRGYLHLVQESRS